MKLCAHCRKKIDTQATKCPYCHSYFTDAEMVEGRAYSRKRGFIGLAIAVVFLALVSQSFNGCSVEQLGSDMGQAAQ